MAAAAEVVKGEDDLDLVWGATDIAAVLKLPGKSGRRKTFRLLETGAIPARKVGGSWVASRRKLRERVLGEDVGASADAR